MKQAGKFSSEQQQQRSSEQQAHTQPGLEFASADEVLRYDAARTQVPPQIAERLHHSLADLPQPARRPSWWRRFFGGNKP